MAAVFSIGDMYLLRKTECLDNFGSHALKQCCVGPHVHKCLVDHHSNKKCYMVFTFTEVPC